MIAVKIPRHKCQTRLIAPFLLAVTCSTKRELCVETVPIPKPPKHCGFKSIHDKPVMEYLADFPGATVAQVTLTVGISKSSANNLLNRLTLAGAVVKSRMEDYVKGQARFRYSLKGAGIK